MSVEVLMQRHQQQGEKQGQQEGLMYPSRKRDGSAEGD